jgi:hypothetical protein
MKKNLPQISELWTKTEKLDPELVRYKKKDALGISIRHPLLYDILYLPKRNAEFNYRFQFKKQMLADTLKKKKYHQYVLHYERPYRLQAIQNLIDLKTVSKKNIAEVIFWCWLDSENIWELLPEWKKLLKKYKKELRICMSASDKKIFTQLPDTIEIFRGCNKRNEKGISFTLSKTKAEWFSNRFSERGSKVIMKTVKKEKVVFYTDQRSEKEIVLL